MKTKQNFLRLISVMIVVALTTFAISCKKDADPISGEVAQTASNESTQDAQQDEIDDMVVAQLNVGDPEGGRTATDPDVRTACALITFTAQGESGESGTLEIDFDTKANGDPNPDGCTDTHGNVRKGKITVVWSNGRWWHQGATIEILLDDYNINGVVINGTRTLTNITTNALKPTWTIEANHSVQWPNSLTSLRTVNKTRQWDIAAGTLTVTQTSEGTPAATGTTRLGRTYSVQITAPMLYKFSCLGTSKVYIAVSGTKVIDTNGKILTVDFGTGECDNTYTVTFDGRTRTLTGKNDGTND